MKAPKEFAGPLAERIGQFVAFKRMQGCAYADGLDRLRRFAVSVPAAEAARGVLCGEDFARYRLEIAGLKRSTQSGQLSIVRQFSRYLHALEPESAVLPAGLLPRRPKPIRFHPLQAAQIGELMAAVGILKPRSGIRAPCIRFLIGLLYSTGLRIGEALALNLGDVDAGQATLFVRQGKFRKERLVPMSPSTLEALREWLARRVPYAGGEASAPLLVARWNQRLTRPQAAHAFRRLCIRCGLTAEPPPRLHDLRHNYACRCLARWREAQEEVDALLPVLATAMGHVDFHGTQVYLHVDAEALRGASAKFRTHVHHRLEPLK